MTCLEAVQEVRRVQMKYVKRMDGSWRVDRKGISRLVVLTKRYAFKFPNFLGYKGSRWRLFLQGLLANGQEKLFWKQGGYPELCPVLFTLPLGFLVVMPRATILSDEEFSKWDVGKFCNKKDYCIPGEAKVDSFGRLGNGQIVCVDYGN